MRKYSICRGPPLHIADAPFWRTDVSPPSLNNRRKHSSNSLPQKWSKPVLTSKKCLIVYWRLLAQQRNRTVVSSAAAVVWARIECTAIGCRSVIYTLSSSQERTVHLCPAAHLLIRKSRSSASCACCSSGGLPGYYASGAF